MTARLSRSGALLSLLLAAAAPAAAQTAAAPAAPPPFKPDRTAEDYAYLADPARRGDWSDAYKFIPLDRDGDVFLSLGGEVRERAEMIDAPRFGLGGAGDDTYLLQRVLVHADLRIGPVLRVFAQIGAHEAFGKTILMPPDEDRLDVHQAFLELRPAPGLSARIGRQEMMFSPLQRFVSFRDGTNVRQNFDGGRVTFTRGRVRLEGFATRPVRLARGTFDDRSHPDQVFSGLYGAWTLAPSVTLDAYAFRLDREDLPTGRERRDSLGLRFAGTRGAADWDLEAVRQSGHGAGREVEAWALSADLGWSLAASPLRPRLGLRFDAGSGDGDPADDRLGTFHPLFPSGPYFNEANLTSWSNLVALRPNVRIQPAERLTLAAGLQFKWREDRDDAVYLGPTTPLAATRGNRARRIGEVLTLDAQYQLNRNIALRAYYLHHGAGPAIDLGGGRAVDFLMGSATVRF